jgi:hypothetical protein
MSGRTKKPSAAPDEEFRLTSGRGARGRIATLVVDIAIALFVGGLAGIVLYLVLEAL